MRGGNASSYSTENGNLITKVDKNRAAYTMGYDGLNRLISQTATSTKGDNSVKNIEYYLQGGIKSLSENGKKINYQYNELGLVKTEWDGFSKKQFVYDADGNRKSLNLTCQDKLILDASYNYDKLNRMVEVKREGTPEAQYAYDENSNLKETKYADGSFGTRYSYNLANQVKGIENFNATNTVPKFTYDYQADGNRIAENDGTANTNKKFAYDDANRLILEQYSQGKNQGTKFDDYGNIVSQENQGDFTTYQYDLNSRLTYKCQKVGTVLTISKYTYDANGSQVSIRTIKSTDKQAVNNIEGTFLTNKGASEFFEYNVLGQLVKVTRPGKQATYTYNPTGLRDAITVNGQTKRQIWDVGNVVAETDKYGTLQATYLYGTSLVSKKDSLGKEYFYFKNAHNDVVALTDRQGKVCKTYDYDSYGNFTSKGDQIENPFTYFGQYFDEETGNYYLRARYYSPSQQRFITEDSYRGVETDPLSLNLYLYCSGNPVRFIDSSGNMPVYALQGISGAYNANKLSAEYVSIFTLSANGKGVYTALHEIAQLNIAKALSESGQVSILEYSITSKTEKNKNGKLKKYEADVVSGQYVWEVKPIGTTGAAQAQKYCDDGNLRKGKTMKEITDIPIFGDYKMGIRFNQPGEAHYYLYKVSDKGMKVILSPVEIKNEYDEKLLILGAAGTTVAVGTCLEDIFTGGFGTADDLPCLVAYLKMAQEILAN